MTKRILGVVLSVVFLALVFCRIYSLYRPQEGEWDYVHPDYDYTYSEEYHRQKISEQTQEIFEEELSSGKIVNFEVETVYAINDGDPEFFLVTLEYEQEIEGKNYTTGIEYKTKYQHIIGFHHGKGSYYAGLPTYRSFENGESAWQYLGYQNSKKYYDIGNYAVLEGDEILRIYRGDYPIGTGNEYSENYDKVIIPTAEQKNYKLEGYVLHLEYSNLEYSRRAKK